MDQINHVGTICIEGLHGVGKQTLLDSISKDLLTAGCTPILLKGHGRIQGLGHFPGDPKSDRFEKNYDKLADHSLPKETFKALRRKAAQILQKDFIDVYLAVQKSSIPNPFIILDRGLISNFFTEKQRNPGFKFKQLLSPSYLSDHTILDVRNIIISDLYIVLTEELPKLLGRRSDAEKQGQSTKDFKTQNLKNSYSLFMNIIKNPPSEISNRIHIINGTPNLDIQHKNTEEIKEASIKKVYEDAKRIILSKFPECFDNKYNNISL